MPRHLDTGSIIIMAITLLLFVAALFVKGLGHDLFLEAGVFLVSLKIILMAYKNSVDLARLEAKLDALRDLQLVERRDGPSPESRRQEDA